MRATRTLFLLASLLALALFAAGCGDDDDGGDSKARQADETSETERDADVPPGAEDSPVLDPDSAGGEDAKFTIQVKDGEVIGGPQAMPVTVGDTVRIEMLTDEPDEAHLHGIDKEAKVDPAGVIEFKAKDPGSYELEFHDSGLVLGTVNVS